MDQNQKKNEEKKIVRISFTLFVFVTKMYAHCIVFEHDKN